MGIGKLAPIGNAIACDIRELKEPGLLLPIRKSDEIVAITRWDDVMYGIMLTGPQAFIYFTINIRNPHEGLFIPSPEIVVDRTTASRGVNHENEEGAAILEQDKFSVVATLAGDRFADPQLVPLWATVSGGSSGAKVAFTRWGLGLRHGEKLDELWVREPLSAQ